MKKILNVLALALAMNFLLVAGGVGWLWNSGRLNREKVKQVKAVLFSPPATQPAGPTTKPVLATDTASKLDQLLAKSAGRPTGEQVDLLRQTVEAQVVQLDRRERELADLQAQIDLARSQTTRDREDLAKQRTALAAERDEQAKLASDKGFQDALQLYTSMPPKQAKSQFMTLPDDTVLKYMRAMDPDSAAKIVKEFKTPAEAARIQQVLEKIRQGTPTTPPASASTQ